MKQILLIHGGDSFSSYHAYLESLKNWTVHYERLKPSNKWKQWLASELTDCDVLAPNMPNSANAVYDEWVIYFEKLLPFLGDDVRLVGHSLGAMFLAKYLHQNVLDKKVRQLILIAGQYGEHADGEDVGSFLVESATGLERSADEIHLFHSTDDPVVDYSSLAKFASDLPAAVTHSFTNRQHFNEPTFPEVLKLIKQA